MRREASSRRVPRRSDGGPFAGSRYGSPRLCCSHGPGFRHRSPRSSFRRHRFYRILGIVAFVKRDCPTCELVAPVLAALAKRVPLTVYTQDDPNFPPSLAPIDDSDLSISWHHAIEAVPTLLRVEDGREVERAVGWQRGEWQDLTGVEGLGANLPEWRPGCGSLSVDPIRARELDLRFNGSKLKARRVELATLEDEHEACFDRGWSDGLPVVPPTEARVLAMLAGTKRAPDEIVAVVPPDLVPCTVEKVAINAVMAGCKPEYLPVVLTAVEMACTPEFNIHGVLATTMSVGPVLIVNGPIRRAIGMNSGINALGQGNRANSTIGRALQLVIRNVGGGRPGEVDRATLGNPGKLGFCFAEDEEGSPWTPLSTEFGFEAGKNVITIFPGEGPRTLVDQIARTAEELAEHLRLPPARHAFAEGGDGLRCDPRRLAGPFPGLPRGRLVEGPAAQATDRADDDGRRRSRARGASESRRDCPRPFAGG